MLTFCFEALKADSVVSTAFTDNAASNAVSLRTGYQVDGIQRVVRDGIAATQTRYRMDRARWAEVRATNQEILGTDVAVTGVDALLADLEPNTPSP